MRPPSLDDAAAIATVINTCDLEVGGPPESSEDRVRFHWETPGVDLAADHRVVTDAAGHVVAYAEFDAWKPWTLLAFDGYVLPDHRGLGIGSAILAWGVQRAEAEAERAPAGHRVVLRHFLWADALRDRDFLEANGWQVCRWFYNMLIELDGPVPEPARIDGIAIRPMRPGEERAVWAADDEAFRDHWGYASEPYDEWLHRHLGKPEFDPALLFLAMDGEEIAGYSLNYASKPDDPRKGWVQILGVRRPWRRRGIALALLLASFRALKQRGCERVGLGVDAESPTGAVALYEKAGMRVEREAVALEIELRPGD